MQPRQADNSVGLNRLKTITTNSSSSDTDQAAEIRDGNRTEFGTYGNTERNRTNRMATSVRFGFVSGAQRRGGYRYLYHPPQKKNQPK